MSRYIDADVTLETLKEFLIKTATNNVEYKRDVDEVCKDIADNRLSVWMEYVPTADVVEVVHGEWVPNESDRHHHCSVCMEDALCKEDWQFLDCVEILSEYCPNCGAKMDGKK